MGSREAFTMDRWTRRVTVAVASALIALTVACAPAPSSDSAPTDSAETTAATAAAQAPSAAPQSDTQAPAPETVSAADEDVAVASNVTDEDPPYVIECDDDGNCLVDKGTYIGWRTYHGSCAVCHAENAVGSTFAPSLLTRLQEIDKARFYDSVTNGYTGQVGVMPAWGADPNVNTRFDELYAYLRARSDGILASGRPTRKR